MDDQMDLGFTGERDWDKAFEFELACGIKHRWDFPVELGDWCICAQVRWEA